MMAEYKDTFKTCRSCSDGTYVVYPDNVKRCRYCGQIEAVAKTAARKSD